MLVLFFIIIIIVKKIITVEDAKEKRTSKKIEAGKKTMIIPCKEIQDSLRFWILHRGSVQTSDTGFQYLSVELGFRIPIVSGVLDSLSCIPDSKAQDFWFHKQNFLGFRNPINGSETNLGLVIKLALNLPGKDKDKLINIWISYIWTASIGTPKVSRIRQTANGKRQTANGKRQTADSSLEFLKIENEQIKTAQNNSYEQKLPESTKLFRSRNDEQ